MPEKQYDYNDFPLPASWSNDRKWQRIRALLIGAVSVEVLKASSGYTLRVWVRKRS